MTHFRFRWRKLGGHVHVDVWSGTERQVTHGKNGTLVFRENEWEDFTRLCRDAAGAGEFSAIEIIHAGDAPDGVLDPHGWTPWSGS